MNDVRTLALIDDLLQMPVETPWAEFKKDNSGPNRIGKLISAISNGLKLADKHFAYMVWGIRNADDEGLIKQMCPAHLCIGYIPSWHEVVYFLDRVLILKVEKRDIHIKCKL